MGAVTSLRPRGGKLTKEADTDLPLQVGAKLAFHADEERSIILPHDKITEVIPRDEWILREDCVSFVRGMQKSLIAVVEKHYPDLKSSNEA